jgi:hypothetical protein
VQDGRAGRRRFAVQYVQRGTGDLARVERVDQRLLVDDLPRLVLIR